MSKLLMISGDRALASGKKGAFYNTLEEFHKYWERIDILCPATRDKRQETRDFFGNVFVHSSPWPLIFQPWRILKKGLQIYREQRFDLMTVHEYPPFYNGIGARILHNKIKVPYVLEIHHIPGHPMIGSIKEKFYKKLFQFYIKFDSSKAVAVRVVNKRQTPEFLIKFGVPKDKIVFIPSLYLDSEVFRYMNLEKKYDVIFVGRLEKNKGINLLIEAAKLSKSIIHNSRFKILIVGEGPEKRNIESRIRDYELGDNVVMYGWAKDSREIAALLNQSRILVMPSYNEGGPRVLGEAMACSLPIITTRVGIALDFIRDKENGLFIDWNPDDIANKISYLLADEELQRRFSRAGMDIVQQFEKKATIKNYADKLQQFI